MRFFRFLLVCPLILTALTAGSVATGRLPNQFACAVHRTETTNDLIDLNTGHILSDKRPLPPRGALQSNDGRYAAYTLRTAAGFQLYVTDLTTRHSALIQPYLATIGGLPVGRNYAFSPDGSQIAVVFARTFSGQKAGLTRPYHLTIANSDGSHIRTLPLQPRPGKLLIEPDSLVGWSADGRYIAINVLEGVLDGNPSWNVFFYDTQTLQQVALAIELTQSGLSAAWSPRGHRFAVAAVRPNRLLIIDPASGVGQTFPLPNRFPNLRLYWSPDGQYVAAEYANSGFYGVFGRSGSVALPAEPRGERVVGWAADSSAVGLIRQTERTWGDFSVFSHLTSEMTVLRAAMQIRFPLSSMVGATGQVLSIGSDANGLRIEMIRIGGGVRLLATGVHGQATGLWSPDGRHVAAWWSGAAGAGLVWAAAQGDEQGRIDGLDQIKALKWSGYGAWFVYTGQRAGQTVVGLVRVEDGYTAEIPVTLPQPLTHLKQTLADSPDGQTVSLLADQTYVAFGRTEPVTVQASGNIRFLPVWAEDGSRVAVMNAGFLEVYTWAGELLHRQRLYPDTPNQWDIALTRCN
jgi:WD40 repeat protein